MHQAFHAIFQLHKHAKGCDTADYAVIFLSNMVCHIFAFLQLHSGALRIGCSTFTNGGMVSYYFQLVVQGLYLCRLQLRCLQPLAQQAMDNQIRITTNGRGEMGIIFGRQTKMTHVFCLVHSLLHGAQCYRSYQTLLRASCHRTYRLLDFLGLGLLAHLKLYIEIGQQLSQILHFFLCRNFVDTIDEGPMLIKHMLSYGFIGRQHKLLNDGLCITMNALHNLNGVQLFIQNNLLLRQIKVYCTPTRTFIVQNLAQLIHFFHHGHNVSIFSAKLLVSCQHSTHNVIAQAMTHIDNGWENFVIKHRTLRIDMHFAGHGQSVLPCIQTTNAIGQALRQHGQHPIY